MVMSMIRVLLMLLLFHGGTLVMCGLVLLCIPRTCQLNTAIVISLQARFLVEGILEANTVMGHIRLFGNIQTVSYATRNLRSI
jgi:hypothetical protein